MLSGLCVRRTADTANQATYLQTELSWQISTMQGAGVAGDHNALVLPQPRWVAV